jgi:glycine cleavage system H protein
VCPLFWRLIDAHGAIDQIGAVESVKAASDIYAPLSGTIEDINLDLNKSPNLINKSPEADGAH